MGLTHVTTRISPLTRSTKYFEAEFLVDTGAIDCLAPASELKRIGVKPEGREVYELADGETKEFPVGFVRVSFLGSETVTKVIFAPEGSEPILGVVALESTGVGVDPVTRTLRRMSAKPLKRLAPPATPRAP
jgi:clan AA aspartic protease